MGDFEKWFKDQDFYTNMRFIHGDRLFDKDGEVYRVLPVQIAYQGWNARQSEIDELKAQLCKVCERLELIQEEFVETETYLREQIEQKNSKITSFEYLVEQDKIHIQSQQSRVVDLKAQLECCRKENAVLLGKVGELQSQLKAVYALSRMRASVISSWKREELSIKVRKAISYLAKKEKALRGEHE